jgi:hypothetical protein
LQVIARSLCRIPNAMTPETLALWYLRLNGFFTIPSYIVHPGRSGGALTDVDVAGVRLPHRREFPPGEGGDDAELASIGRTLPLVVLLEVKTSLCNLNGPWVGPNPETVQQLVGDLGLVPVEFAAAAASSLRESGFYSDSLLAIQIACLGRETNTILGSRYPDLPQRTWNDVGRFIFARFRQYRRRKTDNRHWDEVGRALWDHFQSSGSAEVYCARIGPAFGVDAA